MTDTFARMRQLIGTTAEWGANDLIIGLGEFAIERLVGGSVRMKLGDGVLKYSQLPYFDPGIFDFVLKDGDTMTGPLVLPGITVNLDGLTVTAGSSSFMAPVNLGAAATTAEPGTADDNNAKVPTTHWVQTKMAGVITGLEYKGTWDAATNTPPLASGGLGVPTPARGDFYMVSVAGSTNLDGISTWLPGDFVAFNGVAWQRVPQPLTHDQIVAGLGYTPADDADLAVLEADAIKRQIVDAAGDLIVGTAADTVARLARGTDGQILKATAGGIAWAAASAALSLYSEQVAVGGETFLQVTIPANTKRVELDCLFTTTGQTDQNFGLQCMQGATPFAANYSHSLLYQSAASISGTGTNSLTTGWPIGGGRYVAAKITLVGNSTILAWWLTSTQYGISVAARYNEVMGGDGGAPVASTTGFRVTIGAGSYAAASFLRAYVVV